MYKRVGFAVISVVVGFFMFFEAITIKSVWREPLHPKTYPMVMSLLLIFAGLLNIVFGIRYNRKQKTAQQENTEPTLAESSQKDPFAPWVVLGLSVVYVLLISLLGFYSSTLFFLFCIMVVLGYLGQSEGPLKKKLSMYLLFSVVLTAVLYFAFQFLRIYLPRGGLLF